MAPIGVGVLDWEGDAGEVFAEFGPVTVEDEDVEGVEEEDVELDEAGEMVVATPSLLEYRWTESVNAEDAQPYSVIMVLG